MTPQEKLFHDAAGYCSRKISNGKRAMILSVSANNVIATVMLGCALIALIFQRR